MPRTKIITPEMRFGFDHWIGWNCHHNYFNAPYHDSDGNHKQIEGYEPDFQTDEAIQYCRDYVDEPFCLYMSWGPRTTLMSMSQNTTRRCIHQRGFSSAASKCSRHTRYTEVTRNRQIRSSDTVSTTDRFTLEWCASSLN